MKHLSLILFFLMGLTGFLFSQEYAYKIEKKLREADSVVFVSHAATWGIAIVDEKTGKRTAPPKLIIKGKINESIIRERLVVKSSALDSLITVLARPFADSIIQEGNCYMPHHTLLLFKRGHLSYIEICFGCRRFSTSRDLSFFDFFDKRKWRELQEFLFERKFNYELTLDTE
jgi:hypothetical protein